MPRDAWLRAAAAAGALAPPAGSAARARRGGAGVAGGRWARFARSGQAASPGAGGRPGQRGGRGVQGSSSAAGQRAAARLPPAFGGVPSSASISPPHPPRRGALWLAALLAVCRLLALQPLRGFRRLRGRQLPLRSHPPWGAPTSTNSRCSLARPTAPRGSGSGVQPAAPAAVGLPPRHPHCPSRAAPAAARPPQRP